MLHERCASSSSSSSSSSSVVDVVSVVDVRLIDADACSGNGRRPLIKPLVRFPLLLLQLLLTQFLFLLRFLFSQLFHSLGDCNQPTTLELEPADSSAMNADLIIALSFTHIYSVSVNDRLSRNSLHCLVSLERRKLFVNSFTLKQHTSVFTLLYC